MKLIMTLLVRDEDDIIKQNMDFHLNQGVDYIIVTDNGSTDGTLDILEDYRCQNLLHLIHEPVQDYNQTEWVTRMALMAREEFGAEWVLNNDADEFWMPASGNLKNEINSLDVDVLSVNRFNMVYPHDLPSPEPWHVKINFKVKEKSPYYSLKDPFNDPLPEPYLYWNLPGKIMCRTKNLRKITQGNHSAIFEKEASETVSHDISIYHFPFRSIERFVKSTISIGEGYSNKVTQKKDIGHMGWHRRRWHKMLLSGQSQAVLREVVPSETMLDRDIKQGKVIIDKKIHKSLVDLGNRM